MFLLNNISSRLLCLQNSLFPFMRLQKLECSGSGEWAVKKEGFNMREKGFSQTTKVLLLLEEVHPGFFPAEFCNKTQGK